MTVAVARLHNSRFKSNRKSKNRPSPVVEQKVSTPVLISPVGLAGGNPIALVVESYPGHMDHGRWRPGLPDEYSCWKRGKWMPGS